MRHAALLLVALSALAPGADAQDTLKIEPGERVRLTLSSGRSAVVGVLVTQDHDSLRVRPRPDAPPVAFPRAGVTSVEASLGRHGHAGTGDGTVTGSPGITCGMSCSQFPYARIGLRFLHKLLKWFLAEKSGHGKPSSLGDRQRKGDKLSRSR